MSGDPDIHDLARQVAVQEERMNTHQATFETALERFERKMAERDARQAERDARLAEGMAWRDTEAAKRETRLVVTVAGLIVGAVAFLGLLIRWPF